MTTKLELDRSRLSLTKTYSCSYSIRKIGIEALTLKVSQM